MPTEFLLRPAGSAPSTVGAGAAAPPKPVPVARTANETAEEKRERKASPPVFFVRCCQRLPRSPSFCGAAVRRLRGRPLPLSLQAAVKEQRRDARAVKKEVKQLFKEEAKSSRKTTAVPAGALRAGLHIVPLL